MGITRTSPWTGKLGLPTGKVINKHMLIDGVVHEIYTVRVHEFRMGDVEDPDLYAAQPLWDWQESEIGKWVMDRAVDTPEWHRQSDPITFGHQYVILAKLKDIDYTAWQIKWGINRLDKQQW